MFEIVFSLMDIVAGIDERPINFWLPGDDLLELVVHPHPAWVWEHVILAAKGALRWAIAVLLTMVVLVMFTFLGYPLVRFIQAFPDGGMVWNWWLLSGVPLGVVFAATALAIPALYTYLIVEWNRRHYVYAVFRKTIVIGRLIWPGRILLSVGETAALTETFVSSPGETVREAIRPGMLSLLDIGLWWDAFLRRWALGDLSLPVRVIGGGDILPYCPNAQEVRDILSQLAEGASSASGERANRDRSIGRLIYDADRVTRVVVEDAYESVEALQREYWERLAEMTGRSVTELQADARRHNLFELRDPGRWDLRTAQRII